MSPIPIAVLAGLLAAGAVTVLAVAFTPKRPQSGNNATKVRAIGTQQSVAAGVLVGMITLLVTGWPVGAIALGVFAASWKFLFGRGGAANDKATVEAIASWLEDLRDVVRRSSVAIESALEIVAEDATGILEEPLTLFVLRRRQGVRLPEALVELADGVDHPTADSAVAAIILVVGGGAGGARLYDTLDELAMAARDEVRARSEIDRTRSIYQRAMQRLVGLTFAFVGVLFAFAGEIVRPYGTVAGQLWLIIPCSMWAFCLYYLRKLTVYDTGKRYRLRVPDEVGA